MKFKTRLKPSSQLVDLTPLVDVVFLLLIFFMVTAHILPLKSLSIQMPKLDLPSSPQTSNIFIAMDESGVIYFGEAREMTDPEQLKIELKAQIQHLSKLHNNHQPTVVLSIDKKTAYGPFLQLLSSVYECTDKVKLAYE